MEEEKAYSEGIDIEGDGNRNELQLDSFQKQCNLGNLSAQLITSLTDALLYSELREIYIYGGRCGYRLTDEDLNTLCVAISSSSIELESLCLPYHRIGDNGLEYICTTFFSSTGKLQRLDLEGNDISANGMKALKFALGKDCSLLSLNLSGNRLEENGGMILSETFSLNESLRQVFINNCGFSLLATIGICTALGEKGSFSVIEEFEINRPIVPKYMPGEESCDHFSRIIGHTSSLRHLSLKYHSITDLGSRLIAQNLNRADAMVSLNLECNRIGVAGAEALASYLIGQARNGKPSLEALYLSHNMISDQGAIALAEAIQENKNLKCLTLKTNSVKTEGLSALSFAIQKNNTLEYLSIFGNEFSSKGEGNVGQLFHSLIDQRLPYIPLEIDIRTYIVDGEYMIAELT
jgi:Ran GTPase-activating protein (RanGAP) involved in mRNA processing and transport